MPRGFTLLEVVIVLAILAVLGAAALPAFKGLKDEQIAREPISGLAKLAKEARLHAIREKRPYQIAFTEKGFSATRYLSPYLQAADLDRFLQQVQTDAQGDTPEAQKEHEKDEQEEQQRAAAAASNNDPNTPPPAPGFKEWTESYPLPEGTTYSVKFWHEATSTPISGETVKLWVFQPSGLCPPVTVHVDRPAAMFEVTFNALTADIGKEVSELR